MSDLSVGVIGAGRMGSCHAVNLHRYVKGARVAAIYDLDQARAREVAAECGSAWAFQDPVQLIQDAGVDAVVIASPDPTHAQFVHECLRHHKPVLCEKPLATTAAEARKIIEAEQALGRQLISVGFNRRFDPRHLAVRQVVAAGEIGRAFLYKGVHRNAMVPPHWSDKLVVTGSAIHDIDAVRWLLGQEITEVYVRGVRTHASFSDEIRDMLLLQMVLSGECLATVEVSVAIEYGYEVSAEIVGERGTALTMQPGLALVRSREARSVAVSSDGLAYFQESYVSELTRWVHSVQTEQAFTGATAWDGYMSLLVSDACIQSLHSGTPVPVSTPAKPGFYQERELQGGAHVYEEKTLMNIRKLDHASFLVADVERSRRFYSQVLGLREIPRPGTFDFPGAWLTNDEHSFEVHLIGEAEAGRVAQTHTRYRSDELERGSGTHAAFEVDDLEATIQHLRAHNVEIVGGPRPRGDGVQQVFICDPDGYMIELFVWHPNKEEQA